jgi:tRNA1(Val) A37 N6-methylase TrmN6
MFRVSVLSLFLINFIKIKRKQRLIVDFGTNNGVIPILLANLTQKRKFIAIDLFQEVLTFAKQNLKENGIKKSNQIKFLHQEINSFSLVREVDLVVCNPPFFSKEEFISVKSKEKTMMNVAKFQTTTSLFQIFQMANRCLKNKGYLVMIYPLHKIQEITSLFESFSFLLKRIQFIAPSKTLPPKWFIFEAQLCFETKPKILTNMEELVFVDHEYSWFKRDKL